MNWARHCILNCLCNALALQSSLGCAFPLNHWPLPARLWCGSGEGEDCPPAGPCQPPFRDADPSRGISAPASRSNGNCAAQRPRGGTSEDPFGHVHNVGRSQIKEPLALSCERAFEIDGIVLQLSFFVPEDGNLLHVGLGIIEPSGL